MPFFGEELVSGDESLRSGKESRSLGNQSRTSGNEPRNPGKECRTSGNGHRTSGKEPPKSGNEPRSLGNESWTLEKTAKSPQSSPIEEWTPRHNKAAVHARQPVTRSNSNDPPLNDHWKQISNSRRRNDPDDSSAGKKRVAREKCGKFFMVT